MFETLGLTFTRSKWRYTSVGRQWFTAIYQRVNAVVGCMGVICSGPALCRIVSHRRSRRELCDAIAWLTFAIADFVAAREQASWLIRGRLVNLIALFQLRGTVVSGYYPTVELC